MRTPCIVLLALAAALSGCASPETTVVLVRHAEKAAVGRDPDLTPEGRARAQALVDIAKREKVQAIYVTPFKRTQQTAEPTAQSLGVTPIVVPLTGTAEQHAAAVAAEIRTSWTGKSVLVVGHSNTVPLVMKELGVQTPPTIQETEFARLFIVRVAKDGSVRVEERTYGA